MIYLTSRFNFLCSSFWKPFITLGYVHSKIKMNEDFKIAAEFGKKTYPRISTKNISYGTSGFREKAIELSHVSYRLGLLAVLRSKAKEGKTVGLMITASHNPEEDNGMKLCDPDAQLLDRAWEAYAADLVNAKDELVAETLAAICKSGEIQYEMAANVFVARDTRKSGPSLLKGAIDAIKILKGEVKDFGLLTTPQLHYVVYCQNYASYGMPTENNYYEKLGCALKKLTSFKKDSSNKYVPEVYVDGANGIGALNFRKMIPHIESFLKITIFNDGSNGILNHKCGADYVKIEQRPPEGCEVVKQKRNASFDGDADRLVYFYKDENGAFHLIDGDKIAALYAKYFKDLISSIGLELSVRVIQTAYANGSSTKYLENVLGIPCICVPTGVKHLHHEALKYDVGIYFEANGHGSVLFSDKAKQQIKDKLSSSVEGSECQLAAAKLLSAIDVINETCGDAISDLLLAEAILYVLDWDICDWDTLYSDFSNRQLKLKVPDRGVFKTTDAERKCLKPEGLQESVDAVVSNYKNGRSFVRPSGTEDIVRVYAEASSQEDADKLADDVRVLVEKFTRL